MMSHEQALRNYIESFVRSSALNRLHRLDGSPIFEAPVIGFADGHDPLFQQYKQIIGAYHLTPQEALQRALDDGQAAAHLALDRLSVVCWALPISRETRLSNRQQTSEPSERWWLTKAEGERFNEALRRGVAAWCQQAGYLAVAPTHSPLFKERAAGMEREPTSRWSERHALYAAGLGTFGLSDGFITPKGMAMRCGSVVTNLPLPADPRPYASHVANCLHFAQGNCGKCIARCPAGAISAQGHDKALCGRYAAQASAALCARYGIHTPACGLCQTGVPCEEGIPV